MLPVYLKATLKGLSRNRGFIVLTLLLLMWVHRRDVLRIIHETIVTSHLDDYPALGDQPGRLAFNWRVSRMQAFL